MSEQPTAGSADTLSATMAAALRRVPASLADDDARSGLMAIADAMPAAMASGPLGLELRLLGPATVDFFAAATPVEPSWAALCRHLRAPSAAAGWRDPARAQDLAGVLERWQAGQGALPAVARYLLVECDAPAQPGAPLAVPSIFLAPRGARDVQRPGMPPNAFHRNVAATITAAAELAGVWPDPTTATALTEVVAALPPDGDIFAVGAMVSRGAGSSIRVAVRRLTAAQIVEVLNVAGRAAQAVVLAAWVESTPTEQFVIAFEVGGGAETRVGLEMSPGHDWREARTDGWPELLDHLVSRGMADPARAADVLELIDADGDPRWGLAHVKIAADVGGLLPVSKVYAGLLDRGVADDVLAHRG